FFIEHLDLAQPLAGGRANPAGDQGARGKTVVLREFRAIHARGDESVFVNGLLERNAANKRWHLAGDFIEAVEHDVFPGGLNARALQEFTQARAAETRRADRALLPLHPGDDGAMKGPSVSGAFERVGDGMRVEFL